MVSKMGKDANMVLKVPFVSTKLCKIHTQTLYIYFMNVF